MKPSYPWSAVVGQSALKQALLLCAVDPSLGGLLVQGQRGVAKTTLARALGELVEGAFVELPLGATEERVTGTLDLGAALRDGSVQFSPGLLAKAHEGVLYVDEVNLLPDPLVDLLLDAAASGQNTVERDGVSHAHPARFVLIGTMNPDEGELRPQLTDRFGLSVVADSQITPSERTEIVTRRLAFESDPHGFVAEYAAQQGELIARCREARARAAGIPLGGEALARVAELCFAAGVEGVRADLAMLRAARAYAALSGRTVIEAGDVDAVSELALGHRRRGRGEPPTSSGQSGSGGQSGASGQSAAGGQSAGRQSGAGAQNARGAQSAASGQGASGTRDASSADTSSGNSSPTSNSAPAPDRGALQAIPVRASTPPRLPHWLTRPRGTRAETRRRGKALVRANRGAQSRAATERGTIDWFATLSNTARPTVGDLRYRARRTPPKQLWVLTLDCSTSMLRGGGLAAAKGLSQALITHAQRAGAHVALISFRGASASLEVGTKSRRVAFEQTLSALTGGGGTPLRSALHEALAVCAQQSFRDPKIAKRIILATDGRTREQLGDLQAAFRGVDVVLVDCERGPVRLGRGPSLAAALGAACVHVDSLT